MHKTFRVLQLNVNKRDTVQQSLMNDEQLKEFGALAISEPYARLVGDALTTSPMSHPNWTKMIPTEKREAQWPVRSMLWIRRDIGAEQIPVQSADLTAAKLHLPNRTVMVVSVYVEKSREALQETISKLDGLIRQFRSGTGTRTDVILAGDFNCHDQLWGGDEVSPDRQGEGDLIIDLMTEHNLCSLLPRGTKTWHARNYETTIDLVLTSEELASEMVRCAIHNIEHGSDHRAIETTFDIETPDRSIEQRLLIKNAPWSAIKARIATNLCTTPRGGSVQEQNDRLMAVVLEAVQTLTPRAKPSPYAKRWWTTNLTQLRRIYTYWRNQARTQRRAGCLSPDLERRAKGAAKEFHDAVRWQKRTHWNEFLADNTNIWQAAKYLKSGVGLGEDKIPPLKRADGTKTKDKIEQAEELLATFFPPLPAEIEEEGARPQRRPVAMPDITMTEVEEKVFGAKAWKAPGDDGLPAMVWKQVWPVVRYRVLHLFQTSLSEGAVPTQWRNAKIIPLKKPGKGDYSMAKAWRPISLLSTLGKILEAVIAERISYAVETVGLLPTNHFGARKKRSAEQALLLLQEHIYDAWRRRKVLSLVSFDVKGAYNGVCKERLIQRLKARGIHPRLTRWIDAFCSERTATIMVNGYTAERRDLPQAGLPQGSPLSPVLFLFFNADLVQQRISNRGGAMAFVDDYTAWVTGPTADANRAGIQAIIDRAIEWEKRSGATFEGEKTAILHFTRIATRSSTTPFIIKGETVQPKENAKILGVILDTELRYKQHIARTATKGLAAAMALKRLGMLSPMTARQLYVSTVAPVMDYASNVWMHACGTAAMPSLNRVQKVGAQAITGAFRTVATAVAEAEANIRTIHERHTERAIKLWIDLRSLPNTHPLSRLGLRAHRRFVSPLQKIAGVRRISADRMELIQPYPVPPWEDRIKMICETDKEKATETARKVRGIVIATSTSGRNGIVGMGGAVHDTWINGPDETVASYSVTVGNRTEQNPYTAELIAMAMVMRCMPPRIQGRQITILSSNRSALSAISRPRQQSGQTSIRQIYEAARTLKDRANLISMIWVPAGADFELGKRAKAAAKRATRLGCSPHSEPYQAKSTTQNLAIRKQRQNRNHLDGVGEFSKKIDRALPGKHTRSLYDALNKKEARILVQLRTGMVRLNKYLHRIGAAESDLCGCGQANETVQHFLFRCTKWTAQRTTLLQHTETRRGSLSFYLGGKATSDPENWKPDIGAVQATIKYAIATGRLDVA